MNAPASAPSADDGVTGEFERRRGETLALLGEVCESAEQRSATAGAEQLRVTENRLRSGQLNVVVCGEFKRGKSSMLNALLEEPGLFPVDIDIATNVVTKVSYGSAERYTVYAGDDEEGIEVGRDEIADYVTEQGNRGNERGVRLVTAELPNDRLASGLTFVDTPGVGGLHEEHSAATFAFLPMADVVIFVSDATQPLMRSELEFLERVHQHCDQLLFVVSKIDQPGNLDDVLSDTRSKVAQATGTPGEQITLVPVSSRDKLRYLRDGDDEDLEVSNFAELEVVMWQSLVARRGQILLLSALDDIHRVALATLQPLETELRALRAKAATERASIQGELDEKQARLSDLKRSSAKWRTSLADQLQDARMTLRNEFTGLVNELDRLLNVEYLNDKEMIANPERMVDALQERASLDLAELAKKVDASVQRTHAALAKETGLAFSDAPAATFTLDPAPLEQVNLSMPGGDTTGDAYRRVRGSFIGGSTLFWIGLFTLGPAAAVAGAAVGGFAGLRDANRSITIQETNQRKQALGGPLQHALRDLRTDGSHNLEQALVEARRGIEQEMDAKIAVEQESVSAALKALQDTRQQTEEKMNQRATELLKPRERLAAAVKRVEKLRTRLLSPAPESSSSDDGTFADA